MADEIIQAVCSPRIIKIGKRQYRTYATAPGGGGGGTAPGAGHSYDPAEAEVREDEGGEDWASGLMEGVEAVEQGFRARIQVPSSLYATNTLSCPILPAFTRLEDHDDGSALPATRHSGSALMEGVVHSFPPNPLLYHGRIVPSYSTF